MNIKEALNRLEEAGHEFISMETVLEITNAFGFEGTTRIAKVGEDHLAFLWDEAGNEISEMEGQDAAVVATEICEHLGIEPSDKLGRGSRLRENVARIRQHLNL